MGYRPVRRPPQHLLKISRSFPALEHGHPRRHEKSQRALPEAFHREDQGPGTFEAPPGRGHCRCRGFQTFL